MGMYDSIFCYVKIGKMISDVFFMSSWTSSFLPDCKEILASVLMSICQHYLVTPRNSVGGHIAMRVFV